MPRYTFNGKTYNIPDEKVDSFLTNTKAEPPKGKLIVFKKYLSKTNIL